MDGYGKDCTRTILWFIIWIIIVRNVSVEFSTSGPFRIWFAPACPYATL